MKRWHGMRSIAWLAAGTAMGVPVANAQSSITLYGVADAGIMYTSRSASNVGKQIVLADGGWTPDFFGLKGTEDLGGGLKTLFDLQAGYGLGTGALKFNNGGLFGRQAWVGLGSDEYGTVKAGLQYTPFFMALAATDPRGFAQVGSGLIIFADNFGQTGVFSGNTVSYSSPVLGGLQASASYTFGEVAGDFKNGRQYAGRLQYTNGGFLVTAAILKSEGGNAPATPPATNLAAWGRMIGTSYTVGSLTVRASVVSYKRSGLAVLGNTSVYGGGASYVVTPTVTLNGGVWVSRDRNNGANNSILAGIGAQYFLSKRTDLYSQFAWVNNHGVMGTGDAISGSGNIVGLPAGKVGVVNFGIRHFF